MDSLIDFQGNFFDNNQNFIQTNSKQSENVNSFERSGNTKDGSSSWRITNRYDISSSKIGLLDMQEDHENMNEIRNVNKQSSDDQKLKEESDIIDFSSISIDDLSTEFDDFSRKDDPFAVKTEERGGDVLSAKPNNDDETFDFSLENNESKLKQEALGMKGEPAGKSVSMSSAKLHGELKRSFSKQLSCEDVATDSVTEEMEYDASHRKRRVSDAGEDEKQGQIDRNLPTAKPDAPTIGSKDSSLSVHPFNSSRLYEELRRSMKEAQKLKKTNQQQQQQQRQFELEAEVIDVSRMASHYEAKSNRSTLKEIELRNELNEAIKKAAESSKEAQKCRKRVALVEKLYVESERRQNEMRKRLQEEQEKVKILTSEKADILEKGSRETNNTVGKDTETAEEKTIQQCADLEFEYDGDDVQGDIHNENGPQEADTREKKCVECGGSSLEMRNFESENKEYRHLIDAMKTQLGEAKVINDRYFEQMKLQKDVVERLTNEKKRLAQEIKEMKDVEKGRKQRKFMYVHQHREAQVKMESLMSELKQQRAENDDLKIKFKWTQIENDKLKHLAQAQNSPTNESRTYNLVQRENFAMSATEITAAMSRDQNEEAHSRNEVKRATQEVGEHVRLAKKITNPYVLEEKSVRSARASSPDELDGKHMSSDSGAQDYHMLKNQHEVLSIEMALTRNNVKKLEADNSDLRQQISLLKAEIAFGMEEMRNESGGIILGKYRRGNFEVLSKPKLASYEARQKRRTQSMSGFKEITGEEKHNNNNFHGYEKAQSLIDLSKLTIEEVDERRASLKKYNSDGEDIFWGVDNLNSRRGYDLNDAGKPSVTKVGLNSSNNNNNTISSNSNIISSNSNNDPFSRKEIAIGQTTLSDDSSDPLVMRSTLSSREIKQQGETSQAGQGMGKYDSRATHSSLRSTVSFPHTNDVSSFGNFTKTSTADINLHAFKVPGALRASPAAKSFNSFVLPSNEEQNQPNKYHSAEGNTSWPTRKASTVHESDKEMNGKEGLRSYQVRYEPRGRDKRDEL